MQELELRKGHYHNIEGDRLKALMKEVFGEVREQDGKLVSNFGAIRPITVWSKDKNTLCVDIQTETNVSADEAMKSISAKNVFLERATGFNAKERTKRLQKKAKEGKL